MCIHFSGLKGLVFIISFLLSAFVSFSQSPNFYNLTVDDGLPSNEVYDAIQDSEGFIWFGTDRGAARYDGNKFERFTTGNGLSDNDVLKVREDSHGRIWFLTYNGKLSYFHNDQVHDTIFGHSLQDYGVESFITCFYEDDETGTLYFGTYADGVLSISTKGIHIIRINYPNESHQHRSYANRIFHIFKERGEIRVVNNIGVLGLDGRVFNEDYKKAWEGKDDIRVFHRFLRCVETDQGIFGYRDSLYRIGSGQIAAIDNSIEEGEMFCLTPAPNGRFWKSTAVGGITRFRIHNNRLVPEEMFLLDDRISSVFVDREGNTWFTSLDNGVYLAYSVSGSSYALGDITSLEAHDGDVIYSRGNRLFSLKENRRIFNAPDFVKDIVSVGGYTVLTERLDIVLVKEGENERRLPFGSKATLARQNKVYVTSAEGIRRFSIDPAEEKNELIVEDAYINAFDIAGDGGIWYSKREQLLYTKDGKTKDVTSKVPAIANTTITRIEVHDSLLYLGTNAGLVRVNLPEMSSRLLTISSTNNFTVGASGVVWVASNDGMVVLSKEGYKIAHLRHQRGLSANLVNEILIHNDSVWVATNKGIDVFPRTEVVTAGKVAPELKIESLSINGNQLNRAEVYISEIDQRLRIDLRPIYFGGLNQVTIRYRFHENEDWIYTRDLIVDTSGLAEGNYNLHIAVSADNVNWSDPIVLPVNVDYSIWNVWLVVLAFVVGTFLLLVVLVYFNLISINKTKFQEPYYWLLKKVYGRRYFSVKSEGKIIKVYEDEIRYIKAAREYVQIVTENDKVLTLMSMKRILEELPTKTDFMRVHRSYIVRLDKITGIKGKQLFIGEEEIKVGDTYADKLQQLKEELKFTTK